MRRRLTKNRQICRPSCGVEYEQAKEELLPVYNRPEIERTIKEKGHTQPLVKCDTRYSVNGTELVFVRDLAYDRKIRRCPAIACGSIFITDQ